MKNQFLKLAVALLFITTLITSCKKDEDDAATPATPVCRVTHMKDLRSTDSLVQTYDSQNRPIKSTWYDEDGNLLDYYETYVYAPNKLTYTYYSDATTIENQSQYILNPNGTVHYIVEIIENNGSAEYDTSFYTYDSQGYNTRIVYKTQYVGTNNSISYDTIWYTYTDGNMTTSTFKNSNGETEIETYTYTNLVDKANVFGGVLPFSSNLYGVPNKNLPLLGTGVGGSSTEKYSYEFYSDGYIKRRTMEYVNTLHPDTYTSDLMFYYTCN